MSRDDAYLLDILIAARKARSFNADLNWQQFERDELRQNATIHMLEIIGEAATKLSAGLKSLHPEIPWKEMTGMRHRLVHEYFRVDLKSVWDTVQDDLPGLIASIEPLIPPDTR